MALPLMSHHTNNIFNISIALLMQTIEIRCNMTFLCHVMPLSSIFVSHDSIGFGLGVMWYHCIGFRMMWCGLHIGPTAFLQSRWSKWCANWFFAHVTPLRPTLDSGDTDVFVNGIVTFLTWRELKKQCNLTSWQFDATGTGITVTPCHQHHPWYHCIP